MRSDTGIGTKPGISPESDAHLSRILGTSPPNVTRWKNEGMPTDDTGKAVQWHLERFYAKCHPTESNGNGNGALVPELEKAKLDQTRRQKLEMEIAEKRGEFTHTHASSRSVSS